MSEFYNPYAFVPADRRGVPALPGPVDGLADGPPAPLGVLHPGRWTGRLQLTLTAESPLLLTEVTAIDDHGHATRQTRRDPQERAELLATAVKGMLRSAYEAATNSRYGVFSHSGPLIRRARTNEAVNLVPARVAAGGGASIEVELLFGFAEPGRGGASEPQCAAWVPRYGAPDTVPLRGVRHGNRVHAFVAEFRRNPKPGSRQRPIALWRVVDMSREERSLDRDRAAQRADALSVGRYQLVSSQLRRVTGWYFETGKNIRGKHDERLFFTSEEAPRRTVDAAVVQAWRATLDDYREVNQRELAKGSGGAPGGRGDGASFSSFLLCSEEEFDRMRDLARGTLCYASVSGAGPDDYQVTGLYPAAISRRAYPVSPAELAEVQNAQPANQPTDASIADRVFGFASGDHARRGRVRVLTPAQRGTGASAVHDLPDAQGAPLAILSSPKPSQELFYAGDAAGRPVRLGEGFGGTGDGRGGKRSDGLRGRKVYPAQPDRGQWSDDAPTPVWRRAGDVRDDQNASIKDWVPPGAVFDVEIAVEDLSDVELGALLWLLKDGRRHRVGLGRPLGFGTVRTAVDFTRSWLREGAQWVSRYRLEDHETLSGNALAEQVNLWRVQFTQAAVDQFGKDAVGRFLNPVVRALDGFPDDGTPVRYPGDPDNPTSGTDNYRWFVANTGRDGQKLPLGDLAAGKWEGMRLPDDPRNRTESGPRTSGRPSQGAGQPRHGGRGGGRPRRG